jgi:hypothetical protein
MLTKAVNAYDEAIVQDLESPSHQTLSHSCSGLAVKQRPKPPIEQYSARTGICSVQYDQRGRLDPTTTIYKDTRAMMYPTPLSTPVTTRLIWFLGLLSQSPLEIGP